MGWWVVSGGVGDVGGSFGGWYWVVVLMLVCCDVVVGCLLGLLFLGDRLFWLIW